MRSSSSFALALPALLGCGDELDVYGPRMDDDPVWLWVGTEEKAPPCPGDRLVEWEGWADEKVPEVCGTCTCGPAACVLPSTITAHTSLCSNPGAGTPVTFDAGTSLIGVCTSFDSPVAPDTFASVTYEPPALERECAPSHLEPPSISGEFAKVCPFEAEQTAPDEFSLCITPENDGLCRPGFSTRLKYKPRISDNRTCTPCACSAPSGGNCRADVLLYGDATCTNQLDTGFGIGLNDTTCHDTPAPLPLAAVRAIFTHNEPGTCTPTTNLSTVKGLVERGETRVFCCTKKPLP
ncbi:hypothetical protein WME94_12760 [Sorangium sp. So ce429]